MNKGEKLMQQTISTVRLASLVLLSFLFLLTASQLIAQVDTGAITGTVKDQSGAVIPGAKVSLTNEGTGFSISTTTSPDGNYTFSPLKTGTYTVEAEFQGFQRSSHPHVTVNVQQQAVVDFELQPGQVTQTIEVTSQVPLLQTTNASVGQVVAGSEVNDLPLNGRNFTFLAQLAAGVTTGQADTRGLNNTGSFTANGNRPAQNNYLLDGIDNNIDLVDFLNGTAFVVLPPPDAIGEFKIQTSNYSAEFGRAGGAVLNATLKSGTNQIHGDVWEFLRNDKLDARDFFAPNVGEYRLNQFGGAIGGPLTIPHIYNGKDKTFFFADYQGTRIRQGLPYNAAVPTAQERSSGYTNWSELLTSGTQSDLLGRTFPNGQVFDPATTRAVTAGQVDPVTGLVATKTGYVRDPFAGNIIPAGRIDPNAIKLLNLFPAPNAVGANNFTSSPVLRNRGDSFDARIDHNFSDKDQMFGSFSFVNNPQLIPGPFGGIADGGAFQDGNQTANSINMAFSETHTFSPTLINEARLGLNRIGTGRLQPNGNTMGIPEQFGIQDIPQIPLNGGLPAFGFNGFATLGSNAFLVSQEFNSTVQFTENLTKIYNAHTFKGGFEMQHIKFSTLQPPWSRGQFNFGGNYTDIPSGNTTNMGGPQFVLTPTGSTVPGGLDYVGGSDQTFASNMANTDDGRNYYGLYFSDDWKVTPKLTLNLGVRWDYFGQVIENFGAQANFIPSANGSQAQYLIPNNAKNRPMSATFVDTLAKDNINLAYTSNESLGLSPKDDFAPRFGFAYQVSPKLVVRGGYGLFYGGFENRGYSPNIGENYPFQYQFNFSNSNNGFANGLPNGQGGIAYKNADGSICAPAATIELGFHCIPLSPLQVTGSGLSLEGIQYHYVTPYTQNANLFIQYQLTPNTSLQVGYVGNFARHLEVFPGANSVSQILPPGTATSPYVPYQDFGHGSSYAAPEGSSYYHSGQITLERRFSSGLNFLTNYTYSKNRGDAHDLLNGGSDAGYRAPYLPNFGIQGDYGLVNFDIRNAFKFSGGYELPFGKGKKFAPNASGIAGQIVSGWNVNWILTLQDGQPYTQGCSGAGTQSGMGCYALLVPGQSVTAGPHDVNQWFNPKAFATPAPAATVGQSDYAPLGGAATQATGPGYHRMDLSFFKQFRTTEKTYLEFRAEIFNLANHPNFNAPNFGGNGVVAIPGSGDFTNPNFGKIGSTRDAPNDPREIQFALKFYF